MSTCVPPCSSHMFLVGKPECNEFAFALPHTPNYLFRSKSQTLQSPKKRKEEKKSLFLRRHVPKSIYFLLSMSITSSAFYLISKMHTEFLLIILVMLFPGSCIFRALVLKQGQATTIPSSSSSYISPYTITLPPHPPHTLQPMHLILGKAGMKYNKLHLHPSGKFKV